MGASQTVAEIGTVVVDSREKRPVRFEGSICKKLQVGDYSLSGYEDCIAVERKSFDDLYGCLTLRLKDFQQQLRALALLRHGCLLVESTPDNILIGHFRCKLPGRVALMRLLSLARKAGNVPVWFAGRSAGPMISCLLSVAMQSEQKDGNYGQAQEA